MKCRILVHWYSVHNVPNKAQCLKSLYISEQVTQLSQRDGAAGWVSYGQKWKTGTGRQYLRTL